MAMPRDKKPKKGAETRGKAGATDIPSWAKGETPRADESGTEFAKRLLNEKYGEGNYSDGPGTEFNPLKKYGDRHFESTYPKIQRIPGL